MTDSVTRTQEIARVLQTCLQQSSSIMVGPPWGSLAVPIARQLTPVVERMIEAAIEHATDHDPVYRRQGLPVAWRAALAAGAERE